MKFPVYSAVILLVCCSLGVFARGETELDQTSYSILSTMDAEVEDILHQNCRPKTTIASKVKAFAAKINNFFSPRILISTDSSTQLVQDLSIIGQVCNTHSSSSEIKFASKWSSVFEGTRFSKKVAQTTPIDPDDNSSVVKKMMALLKRIETLAQSTDATRLTPTFFEEPLKKMFMKSVANPRIASFYSKRLGCPVNASTSFEEAKRMVIEGSKHHHLEKRAIVIEGTTKGILGISSGVVGTILVIIALVAFGLGPLGLAILGFYFLWLCLILAIYK